MKTLKSLLMLCAGLSFCACNSDNEPQLPEGAAAITINNKIYYYGLTAFNTLNEALSVATGKVTVAAGTYEGAASVVNSNVTILGKAIGLYRKF